jgi:hypothetical protein
MIHFTAAVRFKGLQACMIPAILILQETFKEIDKDFVITSCNDGSHGGSPIPGTLRDPHYEGLAIDVRSHDLGPAAAVVVTNLKIHLAPEYVLLWEDQGTPNEHIHIQYRSMAT